MNEQKIYLEVPEFTGENVPVTVAATVMKKDQQFIRQGIIHGLLPFGVAFKKEGSTQYDYYISPLEFWKYTGFVYQGEKSIRKLREGLRHEELRPFLKTKEE